MRNRRIRVRGESGVYHCVSRVVGGARLLEEAEREMFVGMMRRVAVFSGVRVLTYAVMSNHFHVLVEVPAPPGRIPDRDLLERYGALYGANDGVATGMPRVDVLAAILAAGGPLAERWRRRLVARMHDVSAFMKTLKQRFCAWFNRRHGRFGTLWAEKFKSVLVERTVRALTAVAAYIDLNPVRAGIVEDPADYRWTGYAAAMRGEDAARAGLGSILKPGEPAPGWEQIASAYRNILFGIGVEPRIGKARLDPSRVLEVLRSGGSVSRPEALMHRIRYFSDGLVIGSSDFVRAVRAGNGGGAAASDASGHPMRGADWEGLSTGRRTRGEVFG